MLIMDNFDKSNENKPCRFFKQLKCLANVFIIPFNISENNVTKENLLNLTKINLIKYLKIYLI